MSVHHSARRSLVVGLIGVLGLTGCGKAVEKLAEGAAEKAIESDTGENVEIDLGKDGGVSVESEDGSFSVNEDGEIVVEDNNGSVVLSGGTNEDGDVVIEGQDGQTVVSGNGMPDGWPDDVPVPSFDNPEEVFAFDAGDGTFASVTGSVSGDPADALAGYAEQLEAAGWKEEASIAGGTFLVYQKDGRQVSANIDASTGSTALFVSYTAAQG